MYKLAGGRGNYNLHPPHNSVQIAAGAAAATGAVEITLPVAIVAAAYIIGQAMVDASGD